MLKTAKVYRYKSSGKLVAYLGWGEVIPLNSDLTFSAKPAHLVRRGTALQLTSYRLEVEVDRWKNTVRAVRGWDERHLSAKSDNPGAPLEDRIEVSPSDSFNEAEVKYIGKTCGHKLGFILIGVSVLCLPRLIPVHGWWVPASVFLIGAILVAATHSNGDPAKIREVREAKARVQKRAKDALDAALQSVDVWAALDGVGFENAVANVFRNQGYAVENTPRSNDKGVDLILKKDGLTTIVQCKAYSGRIGVAPVRELQGTRAAWPGTNGAMLVGLYGFSRAAKEFADERGIKLFSIVRDYLKTEYWPGR
ncbi:MAG: restriction endonuclease [Phycisphaerae bacterium]|nr:restriction endonuclease [Phycisphaerae bacterium]